MKITVKPEQDIQWLATFVHGVLAALHALGIVYNVKRRNWFDVAAHSAAMSYDIWATAKHIDAWERLAAGQRLALGNATHEEIAGYIKQSATSN